MKAIKENGGLVRTHILCWSIYIAYEVLVSSALSGRYSHFLYYLFFYLLNILLFYTHALFVMPSSFRNIPASLSRLPILLLIEVGLYVGLSILFSHFLYLLDARKDPLIFDWKVYISIVWRGSLFILFSTGYYFLVSYIGRIKQQMKEAFELERLNLELTKAQIDFLRSQINPHLLFNTLNFVKYAAKNQPYQADEAIVRLSEIMTFAMKKNNSSNGFVELEQELQQIENIIRLNQLRFGNRLYVNYKTELGTKPILILPIVLLTLVENLFKHGDLTNKEYPGEIRVKALENGLEFSTSNIPRSAGVSGIETQNTGINNVISRLELTYKGRYTFVYGQTGLLYQTKLFVYEA